MLCLTDYKNVRIMSVNVKGILIAIGGNEDKGTGEAALHVKEFSHKFSTSGILYNILSEIRIPDAPVELITTASSIPQQVGQNYLDAFNKLGFTNVNTMHLTNKYEAELPQVLQRISNAGCILFSGGDQFKLACVLNDTKFTRLIHDRYINEEVVIAGTSAGAMAMPDQMLYPGMVSSSIQEKEVKIYQGLSLIFNAMIDTHFLVRGRFRRLAVAVANNPHNIGIGIEEDTGIIIREGNKVETIGSGLVTILDGRNIKHSNLTVEREDHDIFIENIVVHLMRSGNHFTLRNKKIT
jgi:cyanophycinase